MSILDDIKNSVNLDDISYKAKQLASDALDFAEEHKEGIVVAYCAADIIGKATAGIKKAEKKKETYQIWDPKHMHMWELRRKLTNREHAEIDFRVRRGEHMGKVLAEMRVLR